MEIRPQDLDRAGAFSRMTSGSGVPGRTSSSRENLRASVGLEANANSVIICCHPIG